MTWLEFLFPARCLLDQQKIDLSGMGGTQEIEVKEAGIWLRRELIR